MLTKQFIIATIYLLAAKAGLLLAFEGTNVTPIWPATGIGLAAVLLLGYRIWPAIFIGAFLANLSTLSTLAFSFPLSCAGAFFTAGGNTLEPLLGAFLIMRCTEGRNPFERCTDIGIFILGGAILASAICASIGASTLCLLMGTWSQFGLIWQTWWLGDAAGALIITPLIMTWGYRQKSGWTYLNTSEAAVVLTLLSVLCWIVFGNGYHVPYLFIPLFIWTAFRFGQFESTVLILLLSFFSIMGAVQGVFVFHGTTVNSSLLLLQGYISIVSITSMLLAAVIAERNRALAALTSNNQDLQQEITNHKRTEEALQSERTLLRCIIDSASDLIFIKNRNSVYLACNKASEKLIGLPESEQIGKSDFDFFDHEKAELIQKADQHVFEEGRAFRCEEWVTYPDGGRVLLDTMKVPFYGSDEEIHGLVGISRDITERRRAEQERLAHIRFFESMDRVNRAIQGANHLEQMMSDVLDAVLQIFDCDRAWLLYPCDPLAASWQVPMESSKPEYPGANALGLEIPMDPAVAESFRTQLATNGPVKYGPGTGRPLPKAVSEQFGIKSQMTMAMYPKEDKPWLFGMHQCSYPRVWTPDEEMLFQEIGRRLADGLTGMLAYRDLQELSEALEHRVMERTTEFEKKNAELEKLNKLFVGRELRMVELKKRIRELEEKGGAEK